MLPDALDLFSTYILNLVHAERDGNADAVLLWTGQAFGAWEMAGLLGQPIGESFDQTFDSVKSTLENTL